MGSAPDLCRKLATTLTNTMERCRQANAILLKAHHCRDVAQPGRALRSGRRGRWFKSSRPDQGLQFSWGGENSQKTSVQSSGQREGSG